MSSNLNNTVTTAFRMLRNNNYYLGGFHCSLTWESEITWALTPETTPDCAGSVAVEIKQKKIYIFKIQKFASKNGYTFNE